MRLLAASDEACTGVGFHHDPDPGERRDPTSPFAKAVRAVRAVLLKGDERGEEMLRDSSICRRVRPGERLRPAEVADGAGRLYAAVAVTQPRRIAPLRRGPGGVVPFADLPDGPDEPAPRPIPVPDPQQVLSA